MTACACCSLTKITNLFDSYEDKIIDINDATASKDAINKSIAYKVLPPLKSIDSLSESKWRWRGSSNARERRPPPPFPFPSRIKPSLEQETALFLLLLSLLTLFNPGDPGHKRDSHEQCYIREFDVKILHYIRYAYNRVSEFLKELCGAASILFKVAFPRACCGERFLCYSW